MTATLHYWVGDVIGIVVVTPFTLIALTRRTMPRFSIETALQIAAVLAALALIFGLAEEQQFQLFYVLVPADRVDGGADAGSRASASVFC